MNCSRCREALSAVADGEDPGLAADRVDRHLLGCDACRAYAAGVASLAAVSDRSGDDQRAEPAPGLTGRILARLDEERQPGLPAGSAGPSARPLVSIWRVGLIALAIGQLLAALPALLNSANGDALHANHDLGAIELALSASFLLTAWRPSKAAGFVPLLAAVVACVAVVAVADVASGRIAATSELPHLVDALGLALLIVVARRQPDRPVHLGLA